MSPGESQRVHLASATVVCWTHRSSKLIPAASRLLSITLDARTRRERVRSLGCRWRSLVTPAGQPARCGLCEVPPISMLPRRKPPVRVQESRNPRHCTVLKHGRRPSGSRTSSFSSFGNAPGYGTATTAALCGCGSGGMYGMLCVPRPPLATTGAREGAARGAYVQVAQAAVPVEAEHGRAAAARLRVLED